MNRYTVCSSILIQYHEVNFSFLLFHICNSFLWQWEISLPLSWIFTYLINSPVCNNQSPFSMLPCSTCKCPLYPNWALTSCPGLQLPLVFQAQPPWMPFSSTLALTSAPDCSIAWTPPTFSSHSFVKLFLSTGSIFFYLNSMLSWR